MSTRLELLDFDRSELASDLDASLQLPEYRADQLVQWVYRRRHKSFECMTNMSKQVRECLSGRYSIYRPERLAVEQSIDGTRKYLFGLVDGGKIESVLIKQPTRYTLCVSSQVGCAIGCAFCRTALMGLKRNLRTAEIVGQVLAVQDDIEGTLPGVEISNIVFMGMGEPLHNLANVIRAVKVLNDPLGLNFSGRKITVSTSGLVPAIEKFGRSECQANLAISLNATTNEVRTKIMPINKRWPLEDLLEALRGFPLKRRSRITIEYVLLRGINDRDEDLERLPRLLQGIPVKINLIPYNENAGLGFRCPDRVDVERWQRQLLNQGLNATVRWSKGEDINAACGQLATQ